MTDEWAAEFAAEWRCVVVAAAGCGKTELIARAVVASAGRQLVLTHTHAGVRALRDRLRRRNADPATYVVDTISGFSLRYVTAFPSLSECQISEPSNADWSRVYDAVRTLLTQRHIRDVLTNSYTGLFVDEYQDCTLKQHELVKALAELLPTHIVGDPLQGIFDFSPHDDPIVDWPRDVYPFFKRLDDLATPYRWKRGNDELGRWLTDVRSRLLSGQAISLDGRTPVHWVKLPDPRFRQTAQVQTCLQLLKNSGDSIAVIRKWPGQAHATSKVLKGYFLSMEEVECRDLMEWCDRLQPSTGTARAELVLQFALTCMTKKPDHLNELHKILASGQLPGDRKLKQYASLKEAVQAVANCDSVAPVKTLLQLIEKTPEVILHRRELYREMVRVVGNHSESREGSLRSTAWRIRDRARRLGRFIDPRVVSRTTLVKGLEFDHAVIVDADDFDDAKNLYVALTRAARSLTVLSASPTIQRAAPQFALPTNGPAPIR